MIKLLWLVVTIGAQGPMSGRIQEPQTFDTLAECQAYGERMAPRMEDWARGYIGAHWSHPVQVQFRCDEGEPA